MEYDTSKVHIRKPPQVGSSDIKPYDEQWPVEAYKRYVVKPPLGLKPRYIHDEQRLVEIKGAMSRYLEAGYALPPEWVEEYDELIQRERVQRG